MIITVLLWNWLPSICSAHQSIGVTLMDFTTVGDHREAIRTNYWGSTMGIKWDIEKFTRSNDFGL